MKEKEKAWIWYIRKWRKKRRHEYDILENEGKREGINMIYKKMKEKEKTWIWYIRKWRKKRRHEYDILENEGEREGMNMIY